MTTIRDARESDREALVSVSYRTIRASYAPILGAEFVEGWLASGEVETYFDQNLPECRVIEDSGEIIGFSVAKGDLIDLMMIDSNRHREGFGRALLDYVEAELFGTHPVLRLASFAGNQTANAFYSARGWTPGEQLDDPEDGASKIRFSKRRAVSRS